MKRRVAMGMALLLMAVGAAAGVAADRHFVRPMGGPGGGPPWGPPGHERILELYRKELNLSPEQARAAAEVVATRWRAVKEIFASVDPQADAIRREADDEIRALLTPQQRVRFEELVVEAARRRAEVRQRFEAMREPQTKPGR
jgi:Spy/CpxP family protein refolding chaperone